MRPAIVLALLVAGCSSREVVRLEIGSLEIERGFLVVVGGNNEPKYLSELFGISGGEVTFGRLPNFETDVPEDSALVVTVELSELEEKIDYFERSRIDELAVEIGGPPEKLIYVEERRAFRHKFLDSTVVYEFSDSGAAVEGDEDTREILNKISLLSPIEPENCGPQELGELVDFTARSELEIPPEKELRDQYANFADTIYIDENRVLARSGLGLYLARRGERFRSVPGGYGLRGTAIYAEDIQKDVTSNFHYLTMTLDPRPQPLGASRAWIGAGEYNSLGLEEGLMIGAIVTEDGVELSPEKKILERPPLGFAHDAEGNIAVRTNSERVFVVPAMGEIIELPSLEIPFPSFPTSMIHTGDRRYPWLLGSAGRVHLYDSETNRFDMTMIPGTRGRSVDLNGLVAARTPEGELELWAMGEGGLVVRKRGAGPWENVRLVMPPRYADCAGGGVFPDLVLEAPLDKAAAAGDHFYVTTRGCEAVLRVRRSDACVSLVKLADREIEKVSGRDLQTLDYLEGHLLVGGENLRLLTAERR